MQPLIKDSDKPRFDAAKALPVAAELCRALKPVCSRLIVAGSLRRRKATVGDIEILYIPLVETRPVPGDMFATAPTNLADIVIAELERQGVLERRKNVNGSTMFGDKNKLMRHVVSGIPVDLFSTNEKSWFNYLVCRTGPAQSNTEIASRAKAMGWMWNPYGSGFSKFGQLHEVTSEEDVFAFVGMPFRKPEDRK